MESTNRTKYFIAGATSELGNRVVKGLADEFGPERIICLARETSAPESVHFLEELGVRVVRGDVLKTDTISGHIDNHTIYLDMTHPRYYAATIAPIIEAGVQRVFYVTTTGLFSSYNSCSDIYIQGERRIKASGLTYTILRPSMIYGTERDRNMTRLLKYLRMSPVFPVFGDGKALMQPVYVQDLADGIVSAIKHESLTRGKEYNLCGPEAISYIKLIQTAGAALGKKVALIHIPYGLALALTGITEKLPSFPIRQEQVMRLVEDKAFDISLAARELDYRPRTFEQGIKLEVEHLRKRGIIR